MIHANSKQFFALWARQNRSLMPLPSTAFSEELLALLKRFHIDIRPSAGRDFRIEILGSEVVNWLGRSPIGTPFTWLFHVGDRAEVSRLVAGAYYDQTGIVIGAEGTTDIGGTVPFELILLPSNPGQPTGLVGCMSPMAESVEPEATHPIGLLRLVSMRVPIVPEGETDAAARHRRRARPAKNWENWQPDPAA